MSARVRQPWTARKLKETAMSMLGFMIAFGVGLPAARQLGLISESVEGLLRLLLMIPFVIAVVTVDKLFRRYWQADMELQVTRVLLRAMDNASQATEADRQEQVDP
jgi:hypothetical protein